MKEDHLFYLDELINAYMLSLLEINTIRSDYESRGVVLDTGMNIIIEAKEESYIIDFQLLISANTSDKTEAICEIIPYKLIVIKKFYDVEELVIREFIKLLMHKRKVHITNNGFFNKNDYNLDKPYDIEPIINLDNGVSIVLPKNDYRYIDLLYETNTNETFHDYSIVKLLASFDCNPVGETYIECGYQTCLDYYKALKEQIKKSGIYSLRNWQDQLFMSEMQRKRGITNTIYTCYSNEINNRAPKHN